MNSPRQFETNELKFYSGLVEWLKNLPMKSATADQWRATIQNAKGIRQEEIKRSGLFDDSFDDFEATKIEKNDLLNYIESCLEICYPSLMTERARHYAPGLQYKVIDPSEIPQKVVDSFGGHEIFHCGVLISFDYRMLGVRYKDMFGVAEGWFTFDHSWRPLRLDGGAGIYLSSVKAIDGMYSAAQMTFRRFISPTVHNRYERFSLLGGKNYREWLLCIKQWPESYDNNHFDVENVLVHIRTSHWLDSEGQPLMLVDEIQSDWHADKKRDDDPESQMDEEDKVPGAPFAKEWQELGIKVACSIAINAGFSQLAFTTGEQQCRRYGRNYEGLQILYDQLIPQSLDKLKHKYGCAVSWKTITVKSPTLRLRRIHNREWLVEDSSGERLAIGIKSEQVGLAFLKSKGVMRDERVQMIEISPVLRRAIETQGLPLFGW